MANPMRWVIVVFLPPSELDGAIQWFRRRYDPLAEKIDPHITLVHPFDDAFSAAELEQHISRATREVAGFRVHLQDVTCFPDGRIYLNVKQGNDALIALRDRLYAGSLEPHRSRWDTYVPHVTLGRADDPAELERALAEAADVDLRLSFDVTAISAYRVLDGGRRIVDLVVPIAG